VDRRNRRSTEGRPPAGRAAAVNQTLLVIWENSVPLGFPCKRRSRAGLFELAAFAGDFRHLALEIP